MVATIWRVLLWLLAIFGGYATSLVLIRLLGGPPICL